MWQTDRQTDGQADGNAIANTVLAMQALRRAVKMETRHPTEGSFGNEFLWSIIVVELWPPEVTRRWKFLWNFGIFSQSDPLQENFQNFVRKEFTASPIDVLCSNLVKFGWWEIGKVIRYLPDKKKTKFRQAACSHYCADRVQNLPGQPQTMCSQCSRFHTECVNTIKRGCKVFPISGWSLASNQTMMMMMMLSKQNGMFFTSNKSTTCSH